MRPDHWNGWRTYPLRWYHRAITKRGFVLDVDHLMPDLILSMRFDGKCLSERSTRNLFRKEQCQSDLLPRQTYQSWEAQEANRDALVLASVRELLDRHEPQAVAPEVRREIERIMAAAEKEMLG